MFKNKSGIGSKLFQDENIIEFYSILFKKHEINYTISDKEFSSVLKSLNHFCQIILGAKIIIRTNHANNLFDKELTTRKQRLKILLQKYDYELQHVEGKFNTSADIFSCIHTRKSSSNQ
ncbi:Retrovirus-related Pol polyprotein from transposon [Dictyocoela muelleri]|nr:Retrovirus-related Pol polyprotein from transposon [Dictyocoela muelleri]